MATLMEPATRVSAHTKVAIVVGTIAILAGGTAVFLFLRFFEPSPSDSGKTTTCTQHWVYSAWSDCVDGQQTRQAGDTNFCGSTSTRATLTRSCTAPTATPITSCSQYALSTPGRYYLTSDITPPDGLTTCFTIRSGVTLDGNHHQITVPDGGLAVMADGSTNAAVKNLFTNSGITASNSTGFTIENTQAGGVDLYYSRGATVRNNTLQHMTPWAASSYFFGNEIVGGGQTPIDLMDEWITGVCPGRGDNVFEQNIIANNDATQGTGSTAMYFRCTTHNLVINNMFRGLYNTIALFLRDEADMNKFEYNTFWSQNNDRGAMYQSDGNVDKSEVAGNIFRYNIFRSDTGRAFDQALSSGGNIYEYNLFWSNNAAPPYLRVDPSRISATDLLPVTLEDIDLADDITLPPASSYAACPEGGTGDPNAKCGPTNWWRSNTFYNQAPSGAGVRIGTANTVAWRHPTNFHFSNNLISYAGSSVFSYDGPIQGPVSWSPDLYWSRLGLDYNLYFNRSGAVSFGFYGGDLPTWRTTTKGGVSTATGSDAHSCLARSVCDQDPQLADPSNGDFRISSTSPAIGAGKNASTVGAYLASNASCVEQWVCGNWSKACLNGKSIRTCQDTNHCRTLTNRPALERSCAP